MLNYMAKRKGIKQLLIGMSYLYLLKSLNEVDGICYKEVRWVEDKIINTLLRINRFTRWQTVPYLYLKKEGLRFLQKQLDFLKRVQVLKEENS